MTNEALCKEIQSGRRDYTGQLLEQNQRYLYRAAYRFKAFAERNRGMDMEDLIQAASLGLLLSVDQWDDSRGMFLTFATFFIKRELLRALGMESTKERIENVTPPSSIYDPVPGADDMQLIDLIEDASGISPEDAAIRNEMRCTVRRCVMALPQKERTAVLQRYFENVQADPKDLRSGIRMLGREKKLLELLIERDDGVYHHKSLQRFNTTFSSTVEDAVIRREEFYTRVPALLPWTI